MEVYIGVSIGNHTAKNNNSSSRTVPSASIPLPNSGFEEAVSVAKPGRLREMSAGRGTRGRRGDDVAEVPDILAGESGHLILCDSMSCLSCC